MSQIRFLSIPQLCRHYQLEVNFLEQLIEYGLIETQQVENQACLHDDALPALEKYIRLHYELDINPEGIQVIAQLLERIQRMESELHLLKARL
jgi:hypothetical protein